MNAIEHNPPEHNPSGRPLWLAYDYLLFVGCFACAFGVLSPLHDVEIISMIAVPAITVAVLAFRGVYKNSDDQLSPNVLKRLGAACVLAVMIWISVFSVYENEHTPWSSVPVYLLLAVIAAVGARRMAQARAI